MFSYTEVSHLMRNDSLLAPMMLTYILVYRSFLHLFYQYNVYDDDLVSEWAALN